MNSQVAALTSRIAELKEALSKSDSEIALLHRRINAVNDDAQQTLQDKENELDDRLSAELAKYDEQLEADKLLTRHFQDGATQQTIQALIDKQDAPLREEEASLRAELMSLADQEFSRRAQELTDEVDGVKRRLLQHDADAHMANIQAAYIRHKERLASLGQ